MDNQPLGSKERGMTEKRGRRMGKGDGGKERGEKRVGGGEER